MQNDTKEDTDCAETVKPESVKPENANPNFKQRTIFHIDSAKLHSSPSPPLNQTCISSSLAKTEKVPSDCIRDGPVKPATAKLIPFPSKKLDPIILDVCCPKCGELVGFLNTTTGESIVDGNYCRECGELLNRENFMEYTDYGY